MKTCLYTQRLIIRPIQDQDLIHIKKMYKDVKFYGYATGFYDPSFSSFFSFSQTSIEEFFFVAYKKNKGDFVGCIRGHVPMLTRKYLWINNIMIAKEFLRQGYGREICNEILCFLKGKHQIEKAYTSIHEKNTGGLMFWEKMNFSPCYQICRYHSTTHEKEKVWLYVYPCTTS